MLSMKEKQQMKDAVNERKRNAAVDEMLSGIQEANNAAEQQKETHYQEMLKCAEKKDFRRAKRHAKMYMFMDKLSVICHEYEGLIQDQAAIAQMFGVLKKMNRNFKEFMKITNGSVTRTATKNLKQFRKSLARFDTDMDKMMDAIDSMFDEPAKKGKNAPAPEPDDENSFLNLIAGSQSLSNRFAGEPGGEVVISHKPGQGGEQGGTPGVVPPSDGGIVSVGNPFDT